LDAGQTVSKDSRCWLLNPHLIQNRYPAMQAALLHADEELSGRTKTVMTDFSRHARTPNLDPISDPLPAMRTWEKTSMVIFFQNSTLWAPKVPT